MKRIAFFALVALLAACQTELVDEREGREPLGAPEFYATIEVPGDTGTKVFADENMKVLWNADDRITIFNKFTYPYQYRFTGVDGANAGGFRKVADPSEAEFITGNDLDNVYAIYPYGGGTVISNSGVLSVMLPERQFYLENSFGVGANTMVSATTDNNLRFKNAGGYLAFKLYGTDVNVSRIKLEGNNHEPLAGPATITMEAGGLPAVSMLENAAESVTLMCEEPVALYGNKNKYKEFWFVIPPTTFTQGFTVTVTTDDNRVFSKSVAAKIVVARNSLMRMSALEVVPEGLTTPPDNEIWYTSTDGEIVEPNNADCFGANLLSNTYENGKGVMTFTGSVTMLGDESISSSADAPFSHRKNLQTISLPSSVRKIGFSAFFSSYNLTSIGLPDYLEYLGSGAFEDTGIQEIYIPETDFFDGSPLRDCNSLSRITGPHATADGKGLVDKYQKLVGVVSAGLTTYQVPDGVEGLGARAFASCEQLKSVTLPSSLTYIGIQCFDGCTALAEIELPESVTSIGGSAFCYCTSLTHFHIPARAKLSHNVFSQCRSLSSFTGRFASEDGRLLIDKQHVIAFASAGLTSYAIPEGVTSIDYWGYTDFQELKELMLPNSLTEICQLAGSIKTLYCAAATPPVCPDINLKQLEVLYVPAQSVADYQAADEWSRYADKIQAWPASSITIDGDFSDWAILQPGSYSKADGDPEATHPALTLCKVYATAEYIYVYFEYDKAAITHAPDIESVPFHCYFNTDGNASTGGFSDCFSDACSDLLFEGYIYPDGAEIGSYDPVAYPWVGEDNGFGWWWGDDILPYGGACQGTGIEGKYEFQIDRAVLAGIGFPVANDFSIGFSISQNWDVVGLLPNAAPTEDNPAGVVPSLPVHTQL